MGNKMKILAFCLAALLLTSAANADDVARQKKITQIIEAQGLHQMFQDQLNQSKAAATQHGREIFERIVRELGDGAEKSNPKFEAVFTKYIEKCASMWTAEELVAVWTRNYGRDLSEQDLDHILAYYKSPYGKKDVAASQAAMFGFAQVMQTEGLRKMNALITGLASDMKAAASGK
jgi:hypothetical protein